jgi:hypothetical protein
MKNKKKTIRSKANKESRPKMMREEDARWIAEEFDCNLTDSDWDTLRYEAVDARRPKRKHHKKAI